jgi:hypothetical protein
MFITIIGRARNLIICSENGVKHLYGNVTVQGTAHHKLLGYSEFEKIQSELRIAVTVYPARSKGLLESLKLRTVAVGKPNQSLAKIIDEYANLETLIEIAGYPSHNELYFSVMLIPILINQNPCAHWRKPMDMMRHGCSTSLFHASQQ